MSVEQAKAFFAKVKSDEALAQKLKDAQAAYTGDKEDKDAAFAAVVIPVAKSAGFTFTVADVKAAFDNGEGEASEEELDAVAGGGMLFGCDNALTKAAFGEETKIDCGFTGMAI